MPLECVCQAKQHYRSILIGLGGAQYQFRTRPIQADGVYIAILRGVFHGFAIASEDIVLADSLTTYVMGFDISDVSYLHYAYHEGLGNNRWQNVIGVDPPQVKFPYRPHQLYKIQKVWRENLKKTKNQNSHPKKENNEQITE